MLLLLTIARRDGLPLLLGRVREDRRAVLVADVGTLAIELRGIVNFPERRRAGVVVADLLGIERDLDGFGVAGGVAADLAVGRVIGRFRRCSRKRRRARRACGGRRLQLPRSSRRQKWRFACSYDRRTPRRRERPALRTARRRRRSPSARCRRPPAATASSSRFCRRRDEHKRRGVARARAHGAPIGGCRNERGLVSAQRQRRSSACGNVQRRRRATSGSAAGGGSPSAPVRRARRCARRRSARRR